MVKIAGASVCHKQVLGTPNWVTYISSFFNKSFKNCKGKTPDMLSEMQTNVASIISTDCP